MSSKNERTSAAPLPRSLRKPTIKSEKLLSGSSVDKLLVSKTPNNEAATRDSLSALYALAARLHSSRLPFHVKSIETSSKKNVSSEQIWGQLCILQRPVLRRLQDEVRNAQKRFGGAPSSGSKEKKLKKSEKKEGSASPSSADESDDEDDDELQKKLLKDDQKNLSDLDESDLDEEIDTLLKMRKKRLESKSKKGGNDDWRYAFGKTNEDDEDWEGSDEENEKDRREGSVDGGFAEDDDDFDEDALEDKRVTGRNARAMMDAEEENEDDEEIDEEDELAALKELYGEDFEMDADDQNFDLGEDEDPDIEEDIELDDPENEGKLFSEKDGQFWGGEDMLEDNEGLFGGDGEGRGDGGYDDVNPVDGADEAPAESDFVMDDELLQALDDPNLTELEKERLKEKAWVKHLEQKRLFNTNWAMTGETAANKRPREALLEIGDVEFEHAMRAVPVITEAFTMKLEDRIRKRILDANYDDVTRREFMTTSGDLNSDKKDAALDAEKSKLSLMDLYEKEFLQKQQLAEGNDGTITAEPLTEVEKDELRAVQMWKRLSQHLDALSNFHYTPKPVQEDLEARVRSVDKQAPAITMESVGSFATTREKALAPQDLYRGSSRKFADVGSAELQTSERRALRRAKKEEGKQNKDIREKLKARKVKAVKAEATAKQ